MFDIYVDKKPLYTCSVCDAKATVRDGLIERTCSHDTAPIHANAAARLKGKGGMFANLEHKVKVAAGQGLTALLGRSVVWR
jgi:hypothetical protein